MKITKHFNLVEFTTTSHSEFLEENIEYSKQDHILSNLRLTCLAHEDIRNVLGVPLIITSGVRCPSLNKAVGGSKTSKHQDALAGDAVPAKLAFEVAVTYLLENKDKLKNVAKIIVERVGDRKWLHTEPRLNEDDPIKFYETYDGKKYLRIV